MLIKMLPEQVEEHWETIAPMIAKGIHPSAAARRGAMGNVLRAILVERLICWVYVSDNSFIACITTIERSDEVTLDKSLFIYSFATLGNMNKVMFKDAWESLQTYASSLGCFKVTGLVEDDRLVSLYKREFNAKAEYTFVEVIL